VRILCEIADPPGTRCPLPLGILLVRGEAARVAANVYDATVHRACEAAAAFLAGRLNARVGSGL